jgi:hypothetical protein
VAVNGSAVVVNASGKLGVTASSARFKEEIQPMRKASEAILALKPVSFRYKKDVDPDRALQFGLVAEDVEKVNPDLVFHDAEGRVDSVRYDAVNAMLLNEFLKEHRRVEAVEADLVQQRKDFESRVAQQQEQIQALTSGLQKVSAQVELGKPAPQMVVNDR